MSEVVKAVFHFVEVNGLNEPLMLIRGRTKVMTRCDLECVKVSFACRALLLKGDVKSSHTPSVLSLGHTENKCRKYGPSFLTQLWHESKAVRAKFSCLFIRHFTLIS